MNWKQYPKRRPSYGVDMLLTDGRLVVSGVLGFTDADGDHFEAHWTDADGGSVDGVFENVTHWAVMPQPPKAKP